MNRMLTKPVRIMKLPFKISDDRVKTCRNNLLFDFPGVRYKNLFDSLKINLRNNKIRNVYDWNIENSINFVPSRETTCKKSNVLSVFIEA